MDGFECARRIRELEASKKPGIPIIAITGDAYSGAREQALDSGMDDYPIKPVSLEQFRIMTSL